MRVTSIASGGASARHHAGEPARQHGLAGARRAAHEDVVASGHGDLEGALGEILADDVGEVGSARAHALEQPPQIGRRRRGAATSRKLRHGLRQRGRRVDLQPCHQAGLGGVLRRQEQPAHAAPPQALRERQGAGHRAQCAVEAELADGRQRPAAVAAVRGLPGGDEEREGDRQVEGRPLLAQVGGSQVHGHASGGELEGRVDDRRPHALAALLHGGVGQPHDAEGRGRGDDVGLDHHALALEAAQRLAGDTREHVSPRPFAFRGGRARRRPTRPP